MFKMLKTAALSALIGFGAIAAMPASAEASGASSIYLGSGQGASGGFHFGGERGRYYYRDSGRHNPGRHQARECSPRDAVRKASRMGLRDARVVDTSRRTIKVAGRGHGHRPATIVFGKAPSCPVMR